MRTSDFAIELKQIDERLEIVPNKNRIGLSNIKLAGEDICPVPSDEIKEEPDNNYRYEFPNGMSARHNSRIEALDRVKKAIDFLRTEEGDEALSDKD